MKLCIECNGTMKVENTVDFGTLHCDRCFFGFEPENNMCPSELERLSLEAIEALRLQTIQNKEVC